MVSYHLDLIFIICRHFLLYWLIEKVIYFHCHSWIVYLSFIASYYLILYWNLTWESWLASTDNYNMSHWFYFGKVLDLAQFMYLYFRLANCCQRRNLYNMCRLSYWLKNFLRIFLWLFFWKFLYLLISSWILILRRQ